jgi:hypothetical protein
MAGIIAACGEGSTSPAALSSATVFLKCCSIERLWNSACSIPDRQDTDDMLSFQNLVLQQIREVRHHASFSTRARVGLHDPVTTRKLAKAGGGLPESFHGVSRVRCGIPLNVIKYRTHHCRNGLSDTLGLQFWQPPAEQLSLQVLIMNQLTTLLSRHVF